MFWRSNQILPLADKLSKRELFLTCWKLVGHYFVARWFRVICSYVKRLAEKIRWDDQVSDGTLDDEGYYQDEERKLSERKVACIKSGQGHCLMQCKQGRGRCWVEEVARHKCSRILSKVKLATVIEGDSKAPFSVATSPRCKGGCYSFPWIAPLYPWSVPYNAEC